MIKLTLTHHEAELLHKILADYLSDLAVEIAAQGLGGFTELLEQEEASTQKMHDHLEEQGIGTSAEMFGGYAE